MSSAEAETPPLQALLDAFNAHDVDAIMSFFTDDCVFDTPRGPAPGGHRLVGKQQVRKGFQARFDGIPDIDYGDDRHWTCGDRGVSEWTIRGTEATGESIEDERHTRGLPAAVVAAIRRVTLPPFLHEASRRQRSHVLGTHTLTTAPKGN